MNKKKIEKFKNLLLEEKRELLEELISDNENFSDLDFNEIGDLVDQAFRYYERELLIGISESERKTLQLIDLALKKIEDGEYGKCEVCHKEIDEKRLEALPYASQCVKCKTQTDKQKEKSKR